MDTLLPVWTQPHVFWQIPSEQPVEVFTFGLAIPLLSGLRTPDRVRGFGERFGYEWLATLADWLRGDDDPSELTRHLSGSGIFKPLAPVSIDVLDHVLDPVPDSVLAAFAATDGRRIHSWQLNAFGSLPWGLSELGRGRQRVPAGYGDAARRLLESVDARRGLVEVHDVRGRSRLAARYTTLPERLAIELEDLAVRRPTLRICQLCGTVYVQLGRTDPPYCRGSLWQRDRQLVRRCAPIPLATTAPEDPHHRYRREYKAAHARLRRARTNYGNDHLRTKKAKKEFAAWLAEHPAPARRAPVSSQPPKDTPPATPSAD